MKFEEPKVEFICIETNKVVYASGCNDNIAGGVVSCTDGTIANVPCSNGSQMFGGDTNN